MNTRFRALITWCVVPLCIAIGSLWLFWGGRAFGAYGDDSPGYMYLAGRMYHAQPIVFDSELGRRAITFFEDEKLARWTIPTHYNFINPSGTVASKYPIFLSMLMACAAWLVGSPEGFSVIQPLSGTAILVGIYVLSLLLFSQYRYRVVLGVVSAAALCFTPLFFDAVMAQPMRELPAMACVVWSMILFLVGLRYARGVGKWTCVIVAAALFGMSIDIRETMIVLIPACVALLILFKTPQESIWRIALLSSIVCAIACAPIIATSIDISTHKVAFKKRDAGSVALLPNIGHLHTVSIDNLFNNQGRYRPGEGSLPTYINRISTALPIPLCGLLMLYGAFRLYQKQRAVFVIFLLWGGAILAMYSLWINPYSRYILPLYPALAITIVYAVMTIIVHDIPHVLRSKKIQRIAQCVAVLSLCAYYAPSYSEAVYAGRLPETRNDREMLRSDVQVIHTLDALATGVGQNTLVMFTGKKQSGVSEVFDAYTGRTSVRFPLDQKYPTTLDAARDFFAESIFPQYTVLAIVDDSTSSAFYQWAESYTLETIGALSWSFQSGAHVIKITPR